MTSSRQELIREYYDKKEIKYKIINYTFLKEFALICPYYLPMRIRKKSVRMLKVHNTQHFDFVRKVIHNLNPDAIYNYYMSVAIYREGIPNQTLNLSIRDNSHWKTNHWRHIAQYPFYIDIDSPDHSKEAFGFCKYSALKVFDQLKNLYPDIFFSGKGFHFRVDETTIREAFGLEDATYNPQDYDNSIYRKYYELAEKLRKDASCMIDTSIYDSRRVIKIPHSLAVYKNRIYKSAPLTKTELERFELEVYRYA